MTIREAALSDARDITRLTGELGYPADLEVISNRLRQIMKRPDSLVIVAVLDGNIAGWLQAQAGDVLESGFRVEIVGLIVGEDYRRRGVGGRLVARAERWAKEAGANAVVVRSNTQRVESHWFYPALGYSVVKTQAVYRKAL